MKQRRRFLAAAAGLAAAALALTSCSGGGSGSDDGAPDPDALANADGPVTVTFWHSMDGTNGETLQKLIDEFNQENEGKIKVDPVFQGTYDDAITKYKAAVQSKSTPSMVQIYDIGQQFMLDSGTAVPIQSFIDRDNYDASDIQPNIAGYYTVNDKLWSMPFNTSMPVLYYNKSLFKKAGLDPDKPPITLDEIRNDAKKLSKKNGGPAEFGYNSAVYGWFVEQFIASSGELYCSPDNGRGTEHADKFTFDNDAAATLLDWWADMVNDGLSGNTGRATADAQNAFKSGTIGITLESTGALGGMQQAAEDQGFDLGVGYFPRLEDNEYGPIIGGASLYIMGEDHSDAEQEASWKFIQFLSQPESQATWHTGTGYFPISEAALDVPEDVKWRKEHPQFDVAVQQLKDTKLSVPTQGCAAGVMPQARKAVEDSIESVLQGADAKETLTKAAEGLQKDLDNYNNSVG